MEKEKVYYRYVREQRQTQVGEFRVVMTLSHVGKRKRERERGGPSTKARRPKVQKK